MKRFVKPWTNLRKLMRFSVMMLSFYLNVTTLASAQGSEKTKLLDKIVPDLELKDVSYSDALTTIEQHAGIKFVYNANLFPASGKLSITSKHEKLKSLLDRILLPQQIEYKTSVDNYIVLTKVNTGAVPETPSRVSYTSQEIPADPTKIIGKITSKNGPIADASVLIEGTTKGTTSDANGNFVIGNVAPGNYTVLITYVGYASVREKVIVGDQPISLNISLPDDPLHLQDFVVTGTGSPKKKIESSVAITTVSSKLLEDRAPLNSADAIKAIPGVMVSSSGGDGPGNVRVRGLPSSGGYQFFGVMEDGLPVLPTGFNSTPSPDQNFKADLTIKTIEAIRGGNAPLLMVNTAGALMNNLSYTGADKMYGKFRITTGLSQQMFRVDGNVGGRISKKVKYNVGGFYRTDDGIRPPTYTANLGGQLKANFTWNFNSKGYLRLYTKYINDRVQWQLAAPYPYNPEHKAEAFSTFDLYRHTLVTSEPNFSVKLPDGTVKNINLEDGYRTKLGSAGLLFNYTVAGWNIKNNFRYQYNDITANFPLTAGTVAFAANKNYYYTNGQQLATPSGYYVSQQLSSTRRLESQVIDYLDLTKKAGKHSMTVGGGVYAYNVISNETVNAVTNVELKNQPKVILAGSPTAIAATAVSNNGMGGQVKYDGLTVMSSLYAMDEFAVTDKLRIEAGGRIDFFNLDGKKGAYSGKSMASGGSGFVISGKTPWSNNETYWSASVAANYKVNNSLAFYIRGTRSYNAFNIADFTALDYNPANYVKKREVLMSELGTKYSNKKLSLFSSLSYTVGKNLFQGLQVPSATGGFIAQSTFASSRSISWESEVTYELVKGLNLRLTSTIQDPIFTQHVFTVDSSARADIAGQTLDWKGNRPQSTPLMNVQLGGTYDYKFLNLFANVLRQGKFWSTNANTYRIPAYTEVVAGIGAKLFQKKVELRSWVNNLLDTRSLTEGNVRGEQFIDEKTLTVGQPMLGRSQLPRSFWLSASFSF